MSPTPETLPSSIPSAPNAATITGPDGRPWVKIFCANCGGDGGAVPQETTTFAFYLCDPCAEKYGDIPGHVMVPDEVFWERVKQEQIEKFGRLLDPGHLIEVVKDGASSLGKLARDRFKKG